MGAVALAATPQTRELLDERSLELIEYPEITAAIAAHAVSERARTSLREWRPIADSAERGRG